MKRRDTREVIIGGVLGPITRPDVVIAGLYRGNDLVIVGRTLPVHPRQAAELGKLLQPAKPGHPWPDEISSQRWGRKDSNKPLTKVEPLVVAEVTADIALQAGQWRHPLRLVRYERTFSRRRSKALRGWRPGLKQHMSPAMMRIQLRPTH